MGHARGDVDQAQLAQAREDRLRVLVVGAGVAGVTVTQLLRRQGLHPVLVERSARQAGSGYMLALMPLVDPVLEALGVREAYLAGSVGLDRYRFRNPAGRTLGEYSLATLLDRFGDYRGISRGELLAALGSGEAPSPMAPRSRHWSSARRPLPPPWTARRAAPRPTSTW